MQPALKNNAVIFRTDHKGTSVSLTHECVVRLGPLEGCVACFLALSCKQMTDADGAIDPDGVITFMTGDGFREVRLQVRDQTIAHNYTDIGSIQFFDACTTRFKEVLNMSTEDYLDFINH